MLNLLVTGPQTLEAKAKWHELFTENQTTASIWVLLPASMNWQGKGEPPTLNTLLQPYPYPLQKGDHVLPCKAVVRELEPTLALRTRCLHGVAQVAGLVGPPVRQPQAVLPKVVSNN